MMHLSWIYVLFAFSLTLVLTPVAIAYAKKKHLLDHPGNRRSHQSIVPRGGGAAAVAVLLVLTLTLLPNHALLPDMVVSSSILAFFEAVLLLGLVGYFDDHKAMSNRSKLAVQVLACSIAIYLLWVSAPPNPYIGGWLIFLALLAMVWLTNLYNFMDGSHGLAAAQAVFSGLLFAWVFHTIDAEPLVVLALMLASVSAGFLFWNFPRPKAFMGDVLSGTLGVAFSVLIVAAWLIYQLNPVLLCIVLASFVVDASLTLLMRILRGKQWYNPHREHAYQRLVAGRFGHVGTWLVYQGLNFLVVLPAVWLAQTGKINVYWAAACVYLLFSLLWYAVYRNRNDKKNNIE